MFTDVHASPQHVAGSSASLETELPRVDDLQTSVRVQIRTLCELALTIWACCDVICLFGGHGELPSERAVEEHEGGVLAPPGSEVIFGVLDDVVERVFVFSA